MRKQRKKLALSKETLRRLEEKVALGVVVGGLSATTDCTNTNCCSDLAGCGTTDCHQTAGTRLC
jgi:hypothetical protein